MGETGSDREETRDYAGSYDEESFWDKLGRFAVRAGKEVVEKALVLFYCLQDPDTPTRAKGIIAGALGYLIVPLDAIPDLTPGVGFVDDLGALTLALTIVVAHVKPEHHERARTKLNDWFGGK